MRRIIFAALTLALFVITGCAAKRNYIVRMEAPTMQSVEEGGKKYYIAQADGLLMKVAPVFGKNGYLLLYVNAKNESEKPVQIGYKSFKMYGDYYSKEKKGPEHFVGSIRPADPNRTIQVMVDNAEEIRERIQRSKTTTAALKVIRLLAHGSEMVDDPVKGTQGLIVDEITDFPWDLYQNKQFKSAEEVADSLEYTAVWLEDDALFSQEVAPGEEIVEKVIIFTVPDYFTNIRLTWSTRENELTWIFREMRLKDLEDE